MYKDGFIESLSCANELHKGNPFIKPSCSRTSTYKFRDLVDVDLLQKLFDSFYKATGIPHTIRDADYQVLSKTGWQTICSDFHRVCPRSEFRCQISDCFLENHLQEGAYVIYQCLNGLIDGATPIIVEGQHLATLFIGQFFFGPPDEEFFRLQAMEFGFDESCYMAAVRKVPIITRAKIEHYLEYYSQLAQLLARMGMQRLDLLKAGDQTATERRDQPVLTLESVGDGFWDRNLEHDTIYFSPKWNALLGHPPQSALLSVIDWEDRIHPDDLAAVRRALNAHLSGASSQYDASYRLRCQSRGWKWIHDRGRIVSRSSLGHPLRMAGACWDITDQKKVEMELTRLDRLNLAGEIAANIGHEIRNPMTTVRGFLQMLKIWRNYEDWESNADLIIGELDRANSIISEFLNLAKNRAVELKVGNLGNEIEALLPLIKPEADAHGVSFSHSVSSEVHILYNSVELRQLVLNLCQNAMEAMSPGGTLSLSVYGSGDKAVLSVHDQGPELSDEIIKNIGTPFFTTKANGTGLGLAVCYGIASRHNAGISLETGPAGTTFLVKFPRIEQNF